MREIKFRGWNGKRMTREYTLYEMLSTELESNGIRENWLQFTGLTDDDGTDIYEGDIVNIIHPCWTNKSTVEFLNGSFVFKSNESITENVVIPGYTFIKETWEVEVIGNIFENPELIN